MTERSVLYSQTRGEGPPVILLHGLFGMGDNLAAVARVLAKRFTVYSLDLRNHGRSPREDSMDIQEMAADVLAWLDAQGLERVDCVGHSLGGKVAMQLALDYPARVGRLVVADIAPVAYEGNHDDVFRGLRAVDLARVDSRREAGEQLSLHIAEEGVRQFLLKSLYRNDAGAFAWRMNIDALEQCYAQLREGNRASRPFKGPTLFIKGEQSAYIQSSHQQRIEELFPNYQFRIIQGTGHWLHAEKPAVFNGLVDRFLEN